MTRTATPPLAQTRLFRCCSMLLALVWMMAIYYLSSHPMPDIDLGFSGQDKLIHVVAYGLLGVLLLIAQPQRNGGYSLTQVVLAALISTLYGLSDEWHQSFVPGRSADAIDLLADGAGALLAPLALRALLQRMTARSA